MKKASLYLTTPIHFIRARKRKLHWLRLSEYSTVCHYVINPELFQRIFICCFICISAQFVFAQNELKYYLENARQNSPLLKDYQYQMLSNAIDSQRIKATYLPQVNAAFAGTYAPVIRGWGYDEALSNLHTLNAMITVSQPLIGKNNLNNKFLDLHLQNRSLINQIKLSEQELNRTITEQYITAYGDLAQIKFNEEMLNLLTGEETILKTLVEKGVYKQTDFLSFLVTVQQQELLISQLKIQYLNDLGTLNFTSGILDTTYTELPPPDLDSIEIPPVDQTVFYNQFTIDSLKIVAEDARIDYSYRPAANLYGDAGYSSSFIKTPYKNFGFSAGVNLIIPIYDGRQREMQHAKNVITEDTRLIYKKFYTNQFRQQIAQLQQQLALAEQLIKQTITQIKYTEGLISAQRKQLITGDVFMADYINAIGNYLNAKNIITQNTISRLKILNQINYWNRKT